MVDASGSPGSEDLISKRVREGAERALAEARARQTRPELPPKAGAELGGRNGPEPVRYGDWEVKGLASDF